MAISKVIIALDVDNKEKAFQLIDQLVPPVDFFKVGLELYTAEGNSFIETLKNRNLKIFLDLKLHDIPNTVSKAIKSIASVKPDMITIHSLGGAKMLLAASEAAKKACPQTKVLAVTVLTSLDQELLSQMGIKTEISELVLRLGYQAYQNGCDGLICSPADLSYLRSEFPPPFLLVTPGVRLPDDNLNDQARVATPSEAIQSGADYLVIGRSITAKDNPAKTLSEIMF